MQIVSEYSFATVSHIRPMLFNSSPIIIAPLIAVTGRRRAKHGGYPTATLLGGPVERGVMQAATAPKKQTPSPHLCPE
jgi:hypothetical protein